METHIFRKEWKALEMVTIWVNKHEFFFSYFLLNCVGQFKAIIITFSYGMYIVCRRNIYANYSIENRKWYNVNYKKIIKNQGCIE